MITMKQRKLENLQKKVDAFNKKFATGEEVEYLSDVSDNTWTRHKIIIGAFVSGGHVICVCLEGGGFVDITKIR